MIKPDFILKGRKVIGGISEGEALVTSELITWNGGVFFGTGEVVERNHEIYGKLVKNKILVFDGSNGSTVYARIHAKTVRDGNGPKGVILISSFRHDPPAAIAVVAAGIPSVDELEDNPLKYIKTGDYVKLDANKGTVEIYKV